MCLSSQASPAQEQAKEINEAILAAVWNEQAPLRGPMWDCEGNPVAVIHRGRWTAGSGPDFEGAMLGLGEDGALVKGSVELHLRCGDWWAHGHHADARYNGVVLHVVLWSHGARPVVRADGVSVPTLVLADYITSPAGELLDTISPLLPNLGTMSDEPCWQRTQEWSLDRILAEIDTAGNARLIYKAAVMESDIDAYGSVEEVFYHGLLDSLGYSANREQMRAVAAALPISQLLTLPLSRDGNERAALLESVLLGAAGFLPSQRPDLPPLDYLSEQYADETERMWDAYSPTLGLPRGGIKAAWTIDRVRPANSPPRRLAAAARLLSRLLWEPGGMLSPFLNVEEGYSAIELGKQWTNALTVPADGYWASHADFGRALNDAGKVEDTEGTALVGISRASDMVVNIVLPILVAYADRERLPSLHDTALEVYAHFPRLAENRITRAMADEALGPRKGRVINGARRQQGLIHLYRLYCEARSCYECPISGLRKNI